MEEPGLGSSPSNSSWSLVDQDYPDVDNRSCQLLGPTALIVQGLMGILVILSLIYKRHREKPMRPWKIWLFDVSKQVVGQMFVHGVNVLISDLLSHFSSENACVSYFLNILIDTTLGVALIYLILHVLTYIFSEKFNLRGFESGVYGTPPQFGFWARQAVLYVVALTTMKFLVIGLLALFPGLFKIGAWLLSWTWTGEGDALQVIVVMGIIPIIMNILQFWLIDSIVKASANAVALDDTDAPDNDNTDREPLFGASSDDEDDNNGSHPHRGDVATQHSQSRSRRSPEQRPQSPNKPNSFSDNPYEHKSSGSSSRTDAMDIHSYPPSLSGSVGSTSSSASSSPPMIREATKLNKKRRAPPAPLNLPARNPQPIINSPATPYKQPAPKPAPAAKAPTPKKEPLVVNPSKDEWAETWDADDEWAGRVGEEDWTGRRLEQKKDKVHAAWANTKSPNGISLS